MKRLLVVAVVIGLLAIAIGATTIVDRRAHKDDLNKYDLVLINQQISEADKRLSNRLDALEQRVSAIDSATSATFGAVSRSLKNDRPELDRLADARLSVLEATVDGIRTDVHSIQSDVLWMKIDGPKAKQP